MLGTLDQFSRKLTDSGLMSVEQLQAFCDQLPPDQKPHAADQLSRQLVENRVLTEYQVDVLSSRDSDPLVVGDYVILEKVGEGGMGIVFKAQHRRMKRTVAVKMLSTGIGEDDSALRRFEREVEVSAKLNHRNIVAALDAREQQGTHYLIMEYVDGRALSTIVEQEGPLPVDEAIDYIVQVATGCLHAHELGIIHRDIKPSNVLVDSEGVVKLLDMGLARIELAANEGLAMTQSHLTNAGIIMGTLDYISPEQALNSHSADLRTDIYSLGCTLYYLLVAQPIYTGDTPMEKLIAHREQPIPTLCEVRKDVPAALDASYRRMVAKRAEDRFQSMSEVAQALRACLLSPDVTGDSTRVGVPVADQDDPVPVLAEVIDETPSEVVSDIAMPRSTTGPQRVLLPARASVTGRRRRGLLVLFARCGSAILGGFVGASLGGLFGTLTAAVGAVFYIWFGWRFGGGYAWTFAYQQGWSKVPPEIKVGRLFQKEKLKWHAMAVAIGGIVGVLAGGLWRGVLGVFIGLTVLALADRLRAMGS